MKKKRRKENKVMKQEFETLKESKLNLNAGDYAIRHCIIDQTYNGLEVHKMLCDAYIAGNNDTLEDEDGRIRNEIINYFKCQTRDEPSRKDIHNKWIAWLEKQGENCLVNFDEAEKEKYDFVSGQFIECRKSFNGFKEDNSYWLEYIGDDNYIGRSDNILNQKFHITPRQLFTLFTWQHRPKENNVNEETNAPTGYGKYVDECLNEASKHFFSEGEDKYSVADLFYAGVRCGKSWLENQSEQKPAWSEEDERMLHTIIADFKGFIRDNTSTLESHFNECIDWLKSIKQRYT
jgi:hypothetical protein